MLAVLDMENRMRLARQAAMYEADKPLWEQWLQACDFFDDDLESGYVRVLMEMTAAGWSTRRSLKRYPPRYRAGSIFSPRWRSERPSGSAR
jgi:hypothetical protein